MMDADKIYIISGIVVIAIVILFSILKIVLICDADIPDWVKWLLIFRK